MPIYQRGSPERKKFYKEMYEELEKKAKEKKQSWEDVNQEGKYGNAN